MKLLILFALFVSGPIIETCSFLPTPQHWLCIAKHRGN